MRSAPAPRRPAAPVASPYAPVRRGLSVPRAVAVALLVAAVLGACGGPAPPGGRGRLATGAGRPDVLVLEGSPYQMGWWHGHLLRERIIALRARWEGALFQAVVGAPGRGTDGAGAAGAVRLHCELCEDQTRQNLSEPLRQEMEGMAAATGLTPKELLWLDVLRDALRMRGLEPRLVGAVGLARTGSPGEPAGLEARAWWTGPDAVRLEREALVIHRKPLKGPESLVLAWPGSLGGIAGVLADGRGYLLAQAEVRDGRKRGFGAGRPLNIAAREALSTSATAGRFLAATKGTMGHVLLGFSFHPERVEHPVRAQAGLVYYVEPDPPSVLDEGRLLAAVPYESPHDPRLGRLREVLEADAGDPSELWRRLQVHADGEGTATGDGLRVVLRYSSHGASMEVWGSASGATRIDLR